MDGTLLDSQTRIPPEAIARLNDAIAAGALFTVATARTPATVSGLLKNVDLTLPAIVMTGATTWLRSDGSYADTHHFSSQNARRILNVYKRHHLPSFVYTLRSGMIEIYHFGPLSELEKDFIRVRLDSPFKHFNLSPLQQKQLADIPLSDEQMDLIWQESLAFIPSEIPDALLFFAMQPADIGAPAFADLRRINGINPIFYFDTVYPGNAMIEAFPGTASKANAIRRLADKIGADRIVAFGDNRNDLPMLEIADLAVAVDNAIPEVKQAADIIIGSNDSGAVADFILKDFNGHPANPHP